MCEETVFWDQNYALQYKHIGTDQIQAKVAELARSLNNSLYTHANFVFLDAASIRQVHSRRQWPTSTNVVLVKIPSSKAGPWLKCKLTPKLSQRCTTFDMT